MSGRVTSVDDGRFVLQGDGAAILVVPEPDAVTGTLAGGKDVTVTGTVNVIDSLQRDQLRLLLQDGGRPALSKAPTNLGDPYISASSVNAAG